MAHYISKVTSTFSTQSEVMIAAPRMHLSLPSRNMQFRPKPNNMKSLEIEHAKKFSARKQTISMALHDLTNAGSFREADEDYVEASILESTEVQDTVDGFVVKMTNGKDIPCKHLAEGNLQVKRGVSHPAIVLRLNDGSGILFPIFVMNYSVHHLSECVRNVPNIRPTVYQVMKEMANFMGYKLKMVRVTHMEISTYFARAYLSKECDNKEVVISLDMRPSDAINLAARAKVPIQVNKSLAQEDGLVPYKKMVPKTIATRSYDHLIAANPDSPTMDTLEATEEFSIIRNMAIAAYLERYNEAARYRDELTRFRESRRKN